MRDCKPPSKHSSTNTCRHRRRRQNASKARGPKARARLGSNDKMHRYYPDGCHTTTHDRPQPLNHSPRPPPTTATTHHPPPTTTTYRYHDDDDDDDDPQQSQPQPPQSPQPQPPQSPRPRAPQPTTTHQHLPTQNRNRHHHHSRGVTLS